MAVFVEATVAQSCLLPLMLVHLCEVGHHLAKAPDISGPPGGRAGSLRCASMRG